jgi:hypothetical protein
LYLNFQNFWFSIKGGYSNLLILAFLDVIYTASKASRERILFSLQSCKLIQVSFYGLWVRKSAFPLSNMFSPFLLKEKGFLFWIYVADLDLPLQVARHVLHKSRVPNPYRPYVTATLRSRLPGEDMHEQGETQRDSGKSLRSRRSDYMTPATPPSGRISISLRAHRKTKARENFAAAAGRRRPAPIGR